LKFSKLKNVQIFWHGTSTQTERLKGLIHNCGQHFTSPQNWSGIDFGAQWIRLIPVVGHIYYATDIVKSNPASVNGYNSCSKWSLKRRMSGIFGSLLGCRAANLVSQYGSVKAALDIKISNPVWTIPMGPDFMSNSTGWRHHMATVTLVKHLINMIF